MGHIAFLIDQQFRSTLVAMSCLLLVMAVANAGVTAHVSSTNPQDRRASILGKVIDGSSGLPLGGAEVTLFAAFSGDLSRGTSGRALTSATGVFVLKDIPPGRYLLSARLPLYSGGMYGADNPDVEGGGEVRLQPLEELTGVVLRLWRTATIAGEVRDENDQVAVGASVFIFGRKSNGDSERLVRAAFARTDDRGSYRITTLEPGEYLVGAFLSSTAGQSMVKGKMWFSPSAETAAQAETVSLEAGQFRNDLNIRLGSTNSSGRSYSISGRLIADREFLVPVRVALTPSSSLDSIADMDSAVVSSDLRGTFVFRNVTPGQYRLKVVHFPAQQEVPGTFKSVMPTGSGLMQAQRGADPLPLTPVPSTPTLWADFLVTVSDSNVQDLAVNLSSAPRIEGRVTFSGVGDKPSSSQLLATAVEIRPAYGMNIGNVPVPRIETDGKFRSAGLPPGDYVLGVGGLLWRGPSWSIDSITANGRELAGSPIELGTQDLTDLVVNFTDKPAHLQGMVHDAQGNLATEGVILVLPRDLRLRKILAFVPAVPSRLKLVRIDPTGRFDTVLLPGDYLVRALRLAPSTWSTRVFLNSQVPGATAVTLGRSETRSVTLTRK